jgi:hypothetical protein
VNPAAIFGLELRPGPLPVRFTTNLSPVSLLAFMTTTARRKPFFSQLVNAARPARRHENTWCIARSNSKNTTPLTTALISWNTILKGTVLRSVTLTRCLGRF